MTNIVKINVDYKHLQQMRTAPEHMKTIQREDGHSR